MEKAGVSSRPFRLTTSPGNGLRGHLFELLKPALEKTLAFGILNDMYERIQRMDPQRHFTERLLEEMNIHCEVAPEDFAHIPAAGPLIIVANHPFGGIEGVIMTAIIRRLRPDVKILANYMLTMIPDMRDSLLFVDPFERPESIQRNASSVKTAIRWARLGHVLGIFPSGEVAHMGLRNHDVVDPPWIPTAARIIKMTGAPVLPMFFEGRNSMLFQLLGLLHPRLRTLLLPHEFVNKQHSSITIRVGKPLTAEELGQFDDPKDLSDYLRVRTYILRSREPKKRPASRIRPIPAGKHYEDIAPEAPADVLEREIETSCAPSLLIESGEYREYCCRAEQIPHILQEIGRLREITFRGVGEGTGKSLDLDRFDEHYLHLFVWNRQKRQVVGAYRMGPTDEILEKFGPTGLYTSTLFEYKKQAFEQIGPALELGRSFIRPEYQRSHSPLALLWKGIVAYVCRDPRYKVLMGAVSISNEYQSISKQLLMAFLQQNRWLPELAALVKAKSPPRLGQPPDWSPHATSVATGDIKRVDELIALAERSGKSVPVLLYQYLKLNACFMAFNTDPDFGDAIDALMVTDLTKTPFALLVRYMGKQPAIKFLQYHGVKV